MYVCGPTVYDHPHLGHARSALTYDVLRRYLQWRGLTVHHVSNITDIDDKIIDRARRTGCTEPEVAAKWKAVYSEVMGALNVLVPHDCPSATEWVAEMVDLVDDLVSAGRAYTTESGVYLRVRDVVGYGDLVHRELNDLRASAGLRVELNDDKEDPLDFALWKAAKPGEPTWDSPFGPGRPGWHIECAAMSLGILGEGFDLHGGGDDLVFPHHTNERAEALAAGRGFANHWMHNAMLNVDGTKMAKSLGNFRTVVDLLDEHPLNGRALRLLVLQTHYRKTMEVNVELIAAARAATSRLDAMLRRANASGVSIKESAGAVSAGAGSGGMRSGGSGSSGVASDGSASSDVASGAVESFISAMDDDLGTPEAVGVIFATLRRANAALDSGSEDATDLVSAVVELAGALGMKIERSGRSISGQSISGQSISHNIQDQESNTAKTDGSNTSDDVDQIDQLVAQREAARRTKDWATADEIRDRLAELEVTVEDTPAGPIWHRSRQLSTSAVD